MYDYQKEKSKIYTEEGQDLFLEIRDRVYLLAKKSGAVRMEEAIRGSSGSNWLHMACVDRMVERGELREITQATVVAGQNRIFVLND
jgi:hypothetical protein